MRPITEHRTDPAPLDCCPECARLLLLIQISAPEDKAIYEDELDRHLGGHFCMIQIARELDDEDQ